MDKSMVLIRILVLEMAENANENLANQIEQLLWDNHVGGLTTRRSQQGIAELGKLHTSILEDNTFNDLPLVIESVMEESTLKRLMPQLKTIVNEGEVAIVPENTNFHNFERDATEHMNVKIFMRDVKLPNEKMESDVVMETLQNAQIDWVSVTKGIRGYGRQGKKYSPVFSFSKNVPLVIDFFVTEQQAEEVLPTIEETVSEGIVFKSTASLVIKNDEVKK